MNAKKLPTILELMNDRHRKLGLPDPIAECRMGWCTQCSCNKDDIVASFGEVAYRSKPTMPTLPGKVLPCIMTQDKLSLSIDGVSEITMGRRDVNIVRNRSVLARLPKPDEVGTKLKIYVISAGRVLVGSRPEITSEHVIVRNPKSIDGNHYSDMLVEKAKFLKAYNTLPSETFQMFSQGVTVSGVRLTGDDLKHWPEDDGRFYYEISGQKFEVGEGTIITENGVALTDDMMPKLIISNYIDGKTKAVQPESNGFTSSETSLTQSKLSL